MKKNNIKKIGVMLLLCVIAVGSYFVSGTYAKYTKALSGNDTATVAKFKVSAGDLTTDNAEVSLFDTIKEADTTTKEENVASGKIAPGTGGQFTVTLSNESEVDVKAVFTFQETSNTSNVPIEYSTDGSTWTTAANTTKEVTLKYSTGTAVTSDVTIYWRWAFEGTSSTNYTTSQTDATDTGLGEATTAPTVVTKVTATYTQVD